MYHPYVWVEGLLPTTNARQRDDWHLPTGPLAQGWLAHAKPAGPPTYESACWLTQTGASPLRPAGVRMARASLDDAVPRSIERPTAV